MDLGLHPTRLVVLLAMHTGREWERLAHLYGLTEAELRRLHGMKDLLGDDEAFYRVVEALLAQGYVDDVARVLTWRGFERLTAYILRSYGYRVELNVRLGRREIDVLGRGRGHTLCIDCKQWDRPLIPSAARRILEDLKTKCGELGDISGRRIPLIVSLRMRRPLIIKGIGAALPLVALPEFLGELPVMLGTGEL